MITDLHFHIGACGADPAGPHMDDAFVRQATGAGSVAPTLQKIIEHSLLDEAMVYALVAGVLADAAPVDAVVALALDAVYDERGEARYDQTHLHVPNAWVHRFATRFPQGRVLFGASVNPNRGEPNGRAELERVIAGGAVLVKWIPSAQGIDPSSPRHEWFFKELAARGLPLLCHVGHEHTVPPAFPEAADFNSPARLGLALCHGVTVIAAHCGLPLWDGETDQAYAELVALSQGEHGDHLYADVAAFFPGALPKGKASPARVRLLRQVQQDLGDRLVLGTDFPVLPSLYWLRREGMLTRQQVRQILWRAPGVPRGYMSRYVMLLDACGFDRAVLTRGDTLLRRPGP